PIAKIVSVVVGLSETTRRGCVANEIARPKSSRTGDATSLAGLRDAAALRVESRVQEAERVASVAHAAIRIADLYDDITVAPKLTVLKRKTGILFRRKPATYARDRQATTYNATSPPPRVCEMWRGRRSSPGSGPSHLPSRLAQPVGSQMRLLPVTVAGPRRHFTGFRVPRPRKSIMR